MSQYSFTAKNPAFASMPSPHKKYFTLAEARRALPLVKRIADDIQEVQRTRLRLHGELSAGLGKLAPIMEDRLQSDFERASDRLEELVAELATVGVELKDPARGLLDFPSLFRGREVHLCWQSSEATITHWHEVDAGFAGRQSVELLEA